MRVLAFFACLGLGLTLAGCQRSDDAVPTNDAVPVTNDDGTDNAVSPMADAASPSAAVAVIADYAARVSKHDFAGAAELWTDAGAAAQFAADLEDYPSVAIVAGDPGREEGAAGSIFITIPVTMNLTLRSGSPYEMRCEARLRRVNNVPGATAKQLRWNIEAISC